MSTRMLSKPPPQDALHKSTSSMSSILSDSYSYVSEIFSPTLRTTDVNITIHSPSAKSSKGLDAISSLRKFAEPSLTYSASQAFLVNFQSPRVSTFEESETLSRRSSVRSTASNRSHRKTMEALHWTNSQPFDRVPARPAVARRDSVRSVAASSRRESLRSVSPSSKPIDIAGGTIKRHKEKPKLALIVPPASRFMSTRDQILSTSPTSLEDDSASITSSGRSRCPTSKSSSSASFMLGPLSPIDTGRASPLSRSWLPSETPVTSEFGDLTTELDYMMASFSRMPETIKHRRRRSATSLKSSRRDSSCIRPMTTAPLLPRSDSAWDGWHSNNSSQNLAQSQSIDELGEMAYWEEDNARDEQYIVPAWPASSRRKAHDTIKGKR